MGAENSSFADMTQCCKSQLRGGRVSRTLFRYLPHATAHSQREYYMTVIRIDWGLKSLNFGLTGRTRADTRGGGSTCTGPCQAAKSDEEAFKARGGRHVWSGTHGLTGVRRGLSYSAATLFVLLVTPLLVVNQALEEAAFARVADKGPSSPHSLASSLSPPSLLPHPCPPAVTRSREQRPPPHGRQKDP